MSTDKVNSEVNAKKTVDWTDLIEHSEQEIQSHQKKIRDLRKALSFFRKQHDDGAPFPAKNT